MTVEIDKKAQRQFLSFPAEAQKRLKKAMLDLENFPEVSNIKHLSHYDPSYRKRVGDYRILFDIRGDLLTIYEIRHRKEVYEK